MQVEVSGMTNVTIRMDEGLKKQSEALFDEMGLSMTAAITLFIKTAVRENRIPFEIRVDPFFSAQNQARLRAAAADMDARRNSSAHELIEDECDD